MSDAHSLLSDSHLDPPYAGSAVEVEEPAEVGPCTLLHVKVEAQVDALQGHISIAGGERGARSQCVAGAQQH